MFYASTISTFSSYYPIIPKGKRNCTETNFYCSMNLVQGVEEAEQEAKMPSFPDKVFKRRSADGI
jgi:hypothetical protein